MAKRITIDDIAKATGLSKYAVSRSISGKSGISAETRSRVLEACKQMGYEKSPSKDTGRYILMIIPESDVNDASFWMRVLQGAENAASEKGYALHIKVLNNSEESLLVEEIKKAAGIIYASHKSLYYAKKYVYLGKMSLLMTYPPDSLFEMDAVHTGDHDAGYCLCNQLIEWGHSSIGYYGTSLRPSTANRLAGVQDALTSHGMTLKYLWNDEKFMQQNVFMNELTKLYKQGKLPTAIMCSTESNAQSLLFIANTLSISIPEELSVVAFNLDLNVETPIPMTGVGLNKQEYGRQALEFLLSRIEHPEYAYRRLMILPQLLLRNTTIKLK